MSTTQADTSNKPNQLLHEKSPYLLQHAYNPVQWYPWSDQAFEKARKENKPIFLSIGYSTCHWCHVMAQESFENEAIAEILNASFISIKVDREERPDIDQIYMIATQAMTGGGGWPMSVFLFPDKKPFYAGTYFPPEQRYNHPGFPDLLQSIVRAWSENKATLAESADRITTYLKNSSATEMRGTIQESWSNAGYRALTDSYDATYCGFGTGNKFPRPASLDFLHRYGRRTGNNVALKMAEDTLTAMAAGGIYDHIGGGFHRYAVDQQWRIPHFEKMLYDQAQLAVTYLHMYQQTGNTNYTAVARETLDYVLRDMQHPEGGLYSAEDADSTNPYNEQEHGEGAFYLWQESEIRQLLDETQTDIFATCYGIKKDGNALQDPAQEFTGRNIPYMPRSLQDSAEKMQLSLDEVTASVSISKKVLLKRRNSRKRPHLDDKIITAWNGLMISALSKGAQVLENDIYLDEAKRVASFLFKHLMENDELKRRWRDGEARFDAVLEDYAFLVQGLLDLYGVCHESQYLRHALELVDKQMKLFSDPSGGFFSSRESAGLLTRLKESYDGAEPSGNSVSALNFLRLGRMLNRPEWVETAEKTIRAFGNVLEQHGSAMPLMLTALDLCLAPPRQLIVAGSRDSADTKLLLKQVSRPFLPDLQIILADGNDNQKFLAQYLDILATTEKVDNKATAYLCEDFVCRLPINDASKLAELLKG